MSIVEDLWCELCNEQPYTSITVDGVKACTGCQLRVLEGIAEDAGKTLVIEGPNRAQRRAADRQWRAQNKRMMRPAKKKRRKR